MNTDFILPSNTTVLRAFLRGSQSILGVILDKTALLDDQ